MKWVIAAVVALVALCGAAAAGAAGAHHAAARTGPYNTWCKAVQPGAQYESNLTRYQAVWMGPGTGLNTPAQACATLDGWQTFVPSSAP